MYIGFSCALTVNCTNNLPSQPAEKDKFRSINENFGPKKNICVSGISPKIRYGMLTLLFNFILKFYMYIGFCTAFSSTDYMLLTFHNKMFRVKAKTYVVSGNLKHTHIYFLALSDFSV